MERSDRECWTLSVQKRTNDKRRVTTTKSSEKNSLFNLNPRRKDPFFILSHRKQSKWRASKVSFQWSTLMRQINTRIPIESRTHRWTHTHTRQWITIVRCLGISVIDRGNSSLYPMLDLVRNEWAMNNLLSFFEWNKFEMRWMNWSVSVHSDQINGIVKNRIFSTTTTTKIKQIFFLDIFNWGNEISLRLISHIQRNQPNRNKLLLHVIEFNEKDIICVRLTGISSRNPFSLTNWIPTKGNDRTTCCFLSFFDSEKKKSIGENNFSNPLRCLCLMDSFFVTLKKRWSFVVDWDVLLWSSLSEWWMDCFSTSGLSNQGNRSVRFDDRWVSVRVSSQPEIVIFNTILFIDLVDKSTQEFRFSVRRNHS